MQHTQVPSNETHSPPPDWSWRGRVWPIYSREERGNRGGGRRVRAGGSAGTGRSWGWPVSYGNCLVKGCDGKGRNDGHLGGGGGVGGGGGGGVVVAGDGGGAKPSPASGVKEKYQIY